MSKISVEESYEKLRAIDALYKIEKSEGDCENKPLNVVRCKPKRGFWQRFSFHRTIIGARWELYLLPMLRYSYQGHAQYINFRWLIWTIDFKVK